MKKDINKILKVNSYGLYTAASCRETGLPMIQNYLKTESMRIHGYRLQDAKK